EALHADIAVRFALRHPERVKGLLLWGLRIRGKDQIPSHLGRLAEAEWNRFLIVMGSTVSALDENAHDLAIMQQSVSQADWLRRVAAFENSDLSNLLPKIGC